MSTARKRTASITVLTTMLTGIAAVQLAGPAPAAAATTRWSSEPLPVTDGSLFAAIALDRHTTWAYGFRMVNHKMTPLLLAKDDRDARGWTVVPTVPVTGDNRVNSVSAVSPRDAWLVGDLDPTAGGIVTGHWDGSAWHQVTVPAPDKATDAGLLTVSARASDDVWAAGWSIILDSRTPDPNRPGDWIDATHQEALLEHWNGTAWQRAQLPDPSVDVSGVTAVSRDDVWAVGYTKDDQPALLHFDGHAWATVPGPRYAGLYGEFTGLAANGSGDVWAVGRTLLDENDRGHALVAHWNGHRWQQITTPADAGELWGVNTVPGGIAVVGSSTPDQTDGYGLRLAGGRWTSLGIPVDNTNHILTNGVLQSAGKLTVVGYTSADDAPQIQPLVLTSRD